MLDTFPINQDADDQQLLADVIDYYHRTLKETAEGLDYLRSRGVTVGEAIDRFRIGYANRTLGLKLPSVQVKAGREIRTRLQKLGLLRCSGHEHYERLRCVPHHGRRWQRRNRGHLRAQDLRRSTQGNAVAHAPFGQRRGVWNVESLQTGNEIILCRSLLDALRVWNAGFRNVTCTFGPEALTEDHFAAFRQFGIRRVLASAEAVVPRLIAAGIECYLLALPIGLDVNRYALQATDPAQALGEIIRKAVWQGKGASPMVPVVNAPPAVPEATDDAQDDRLKTE